MKTATQEIIRTKCGIVCIKNIRTLKNGAEMKRHSTIL